MLGHSFRHSFRVVAASGAHAVLLEVRTAQLSIGVAAASGARAVPLVCILGVAALGARAVPLVGRHRWSYVVSWALLWPAAVVIYHDEPIFNTNEGQSWMWGKEERSAILPKTKGSGIMVSDFVEEYALCSDEPPCIRQEDYKKGLVVIYHDEPIFNTNEGQSRMWGEEERSAILPKMKGSGIMVSDFVEEYVGFLKLSDEEFEQAKEDDPIMVQEARQRLEYGVEKDGYWTGDRFMEQVKNAAKIANCTIQVRDE